VTRPPGVTVVGGGVVGLSCALQLARAGARVRVLAADPPEATTSAVAAGRDVIRARRGGVTLSWGCAADVAALV
jgi:D-amino-acid oxidase